VVLEGDGKLCEEDGGGKGAEDVAEGKLTEDGSAGCGRLEVGGGLI